MSDPESLQALAARIRATDALGRGQLIQKLFDFLIECSATGRAPKETEVAIEVFGKDMDFDVAQDAMVRVYVHKLRRKLQQYYSGAGRGESNRLTMPKGAYRFVIGDPTGGIDTARTWAHGARAQAASSRAPGALLQPSARVP